jgi:hypothetical protein
VYSQQGAGGQAVCVRVARGGCWLFPGDNLAEGCGEEGGPRAAGEEQQAHRRRQLVHLPAPPLHQQSSRCSPCNQTPSHAPTQAHPPCRCLRPCPLLALSDCRLCPLPSLSTDSRPRLPPSLPGPAPASGTTLSVSGLYSMALSKVRSRSPTTCPCPPPHSGATIHSPPLQRSECGWRVPEQAEQAPRPRAAAARSASPLLRAQRPAGVRRRDSRRQPACRTPARGYGESAAARGGDRSGCRARQEWWGAGC